MLEDIDEELLSFISDYKINLLEPKSIMDSQNSGHSLNSYLRYCRMPRIRIDYRLFCRKMNNLRIWTEKL